MNARAAAAAAARRLAAAGVDDAGFEGELLTRESADLTRAQFFLDPEVPGEAVDRLNAWVARREAREPAQYITGHREFYGRDFAVGPGVLIPRPETELLVDLALSELANQPEAVVAEVGAGSGAVAVSVAAERPGAVVLATEVSPDAMRFASLNALRHAPHLGLALGDLAFPVARADVVLANLPYIPTWEIDALEPEVSRWEPRVALDGGTDGFMLIRQLIEDCAARLRPRLLALEVGYGQAAAVGEILRGAGVESWFVKDFAGIDRIVCARWL
ncbi:MAG TPA: peptide chain release factor N(5)-glutamine methyltransferase [Tepidiformaceae bacterium]|nr:peptide chain release factor N(5)-glutamine methyltransferase [Tepidiformaceae bacterium]